MEVSGMQTPEWNLSDMDGKTVLITGATDGVGRRVAERLAGSGAILLIHGRDGQRGAGVVDAVRAAGGHAQFLPADLASLTQVRDLADRVQREHPRLDVIVNNAGIGTGGRKASRELSADGHELRFAVNHLSGFLLTRMLLPLLLSTGGARIVNVASAGQHAIDFDDVMLSRGYDVQRAYCQSKLAQVMTTFDFAQELAHSGISVNCLHPASYMDTGMVRRDGIAPLTTVEQGAQAILHLISSRTLACRTALYFDGQRPTPAHAQAYDTQARQRLRSLSFELVGIADPKGRAETSR